MPDHLADGADGQQVSEGLVATLTDRALKRYGGICAVGGPELPVRAGVFISAYPPRIRLADYAQRLRTFLECSDACYVLCAIYLDRIGKRYPGIVTTLSCHRLLICGLVLAAKFWDDLRHSNRVYAAIGGLAPIELGILERSMLELLDFRLHITPEEFWGYRQYLLRAARALGTS